MSRLTPYEAGVIAHLLACDASADAKDVALLGILAARAFTSDDAALWGDAADRLAALQELRRQHTAGALNAAAFRVHRRETLAGASLDCELAMVHLILVQGEALGHVLRKRLARN